MKLNQFKFCVNACYGLVSKRLLSMLFLVLFLPKGMNAQYERALESAVEILENLRVEHGFPGLSVAIGVGGEMIYADGLGFSNLENEQKPDEDTMFRLYSISKSLGGFLAIKLAERGLLDLNQPIGEVLSGLPEHMQEITSRQLLGHTSGIRHYRDDGEWRRISRNHCLVPKEALEVFVNDTLTAKPGEVNSYTSFGYVLLSEVLEASGGKSFGRLMQEELFEPSGAQRISLDDPLKARPENMSTFYSKSGGTIKEARVVDNSCKFAGGGFNGSAKAFTKVWMAAMSGELFGEKGAALLREEIRTNDNAPTYNGYGFGINNDIDKNGVRFISANGDGVGGRSTYFAFPDEGVIVTIVANASGAKLRNYARDIALLFLKEIQDGAKK